MPVYSKNGDDGSTLHPRRGRIPKSDPLCIALGAIDELNAHIGLCLSGRDIPATVGTVLGPVQGQLCAAAAELCGTKPDDKALHPVDISRLENAIDAIEAELPPLKAFLLPGGCELACRLHVARTVCRRAECDAVAADAARIAPRVIQYLNRLSDLLFVLSRSVNLAVGTDETPWRA